MILEGLVTTLAPGGTLNVAPMGPRVDADLARFVLRPFTSSTTYRNLKANGEGVLHVTDDVLLLARSAIGELGDVATRPASAVLGRILETNGRFFEFRVIHLDDREPRATIEVETVARGHQPIGDLFGLNRAKHAVVEAAILATRLEFLPIAEVLAEFARLAILVEKTGGINERLALQLLSDRVKAWPEPVPAIK